METQDIQSQIVIGIVVAIIIGLWKLNKDLRDTEKILIFLKKSERDTNYTFRANHVIASDENMSEERVRKLCSKSKKIRRNTKTKESWRLI